ncbi:MULTISPECIES: hypothetical protein [Stenotrophomonas]|uniref:hypothetical protein n=1 Tax=Stenotrophomonas TaxID=40323 RepID=UPI000770541B|nr:MULTISPECIES: hypothetical protein [Stenotrophomonas]AMJ58101.1 hypothetical protein AXG53_16780 [Stenotrophomonas sp. KCTC 12332]
MSLLLIRHSRETVLPDTFQLPAEIAGHRLDCCHCSSLQALAACLREAGSRRPQWVLIENASTDEAQWATHGATVCNALDLLPVPYIEIARHDADTLEAHLHPSHAATALVVCSSGDDDARRLSLAITARLLQRGQEN